MFAWGACTHSLTGIVCERVKQWETSQLTDTLSCSHFEWQQRMRGAVAAPVWDSVQTALRADRRLYQSYQSELLRSHCCSLLFEYCRLMSLCCNNMFPWPRGIAACMCDCDVFSFIKRQLVKHSGHSDYPECSCGQGLNRSRCLLRQTDEWLSSALDPSQASQFSFPPV